eukprot:936565-Amphidinium_carterae.1
MVPVGGCFDTASICSEAHKKPAPTIVGVLAFWESSSLSLCVCRRSDFGRDMQYHGVSSHCLNTSSQRGPFGAACTFAILNDSLVQVQPLAFYAALFAHLHCALCLCTSRFTLFQEDAATSPLS